MTIGGIDFLAGQLAEASSQAYHSAYAELIDHGMSPIEALFMLSFISLYQFDLPLKPRKQIPIRRCRLEDVPASMPPFRVALVEQARVLDWPVDFLIVCWDQGGTAHKAVVECDGHEFHERTKEQAERDRSRDRRLQAEGYRVFRFTGRELYRDPGMMAEEVVQWTFNLWMPSR